MRHPTIAPYGAFRCADGKSVLLSIQNEREWTQFCAAVLEEPALAADKRFARNIDRVRNRAELEMVIAPIFARIARERAIELLLAAGIACGRLSDMDDLAAHPQRRLISVETGAGEIEMLAPGAVLSGVSEIYGAVPGIGEHTDALRKEFGFAASSS